MPFELDELCGLRPYLFHLTSRQNAVRIAEGRSIECAREFLVAGARQDLIEAKRGESVVVEVGSEFVHLRDQQPLHAGNIEFEDGWTFEQVVSALNDFVYFWPGTDSGPSDYGRRHFERYRGERPVILRVPTQAVLEPDNRARVHVCRFNSGSPRASGGRKSPRGPRTFVAPTEADFTAGQVVEVTIRDRVELTVPIEFATSPDGPWQRIDALPSGGVTSNMLSPKRKGDIAELHVASVMLADPALEVFTAACDDGHGSDLAVRSTRTGRWYSIQVKAASLTVNPFVRMDRFRETSDFIVAAVVLDDRGLPDRTYLVPGDAWGTDESGALGRNDDGGANGPYVEVRTTAVKHRGALERYRTERQLGRL